MAHGSSAALKIFPRGGESTLKSKQYIVRLEWYRWWLNRQFKTVPTLITDRFQKPVDFTTFYLETAKFVKAEERFTTMDIVEYLVRLKIIEPEDTNEGRLAARTLVFAMIGWQSMLYAPSFGTCPPQQLAIGDVLNGFRCQSILELKENQTMPELDFPTLLVGCGLMLPRGNICTSEDPEDQKAFETLGMIDPRECNAFTLHSILRVHIEWVDVIAPHMEFDDETNTLFLFRYPSFCIANLPTAQERHSGGVIHRFVTESHPDRVFSS